MDMVYVDSSTVDQIGYDDYEREVHVVFRSGRHYAYADVTPEVWEHFRDATSKGTFLNQEFIGKGYAYREL